MRFEHAPARRVRTVKLAVLVSGLLGGAMPAGPAAAHTVYLANENHTDYGWNATTAEYDALMLAELDFYLGRIAATAGAPAAEQTRFVADCWLYLWLYEH